MPAQQQHVVVLGAGVIGLTAAVFLAESGYAVTVIAAHAPGDESIEYTSPWAGAHWRTHASTNEPELCDWDLQTFRYWVDLIACGPEAPERASLPDPCLQMRTSLHYWDAADGPSDELWWAAHVPAFVQLSPLVDPAIRAINAAATAGTATAAASTASATADAAADTPSQPPQQQQQQAEEDQPAIRAAATSQAIAVDAPRYLVYLAARARKAGAKFVRASLPIHGGLAKALRVAEAICFVRQGRSSSSSGGGGGGCGGGGGSSSSNSGSRADSATNAGARPTAAAAAAATVDCFVNATGLAARALCGDDKVFPVKGQTVLVRGEAAALRTRVGADYQAYCIPRPGSGTTILGGTRQPGEWSAEPHAATTDAILRRCAPMVPELCTGPGGRFEVLRVQCGLRPAREGGPRVEKEVVDGRRVVHAYGHAGAGFQNSIGSTRATVRMVEEFLGSKRGEVVSASL